MSSTPRETYRPEAKKSENYQELLKASIAAGRDIAQEKSGAERVRLMREIFNTLSPDTVLSINEADKDANNHSNVIVRTNRGSGRYGRFQVGHGTAVKLVSNEALKSAENKNGYAYQVMKDESGKLRTYVWSSVKIGNQWREGYIAIEHISGNIVPFLVTKSLPKPVKEEGVEPISPIPPAEVQVESNPESTEKQKLVMEIAKKHHIKLSDQKHMIFLLQRTPEELNLLREIKTASWSDEAQSIVSLPYLSLDIKPKVTSIPAGNLAKDSITGLVFIVPERNEKKSNQPQETTQTLTATRIAGKPGWVTSPYVEKGHPSQVDVTGLSPGSKIKCPYTGKEFIVPVE